MVLQYYYVPLYLDKWPLCGAVISYFLKLGVFFLFPNVQQLKSCRIRPNNASVCLFLCCFVFIWFIFIIFRHLEYSKEHVQNIKSKARVTLLVLRPTTLAGLGTGKKYARVPKIALAHFIYTTKFTRAVPKKYGPGTNF